jgi:HEPN domain-containing protein
MPLERFPADDPREWLNRARSNLLRAKEEVPGVYLEDLCFDAQQAAEKAIKGVLIARGIDFPYIHDLARLLTLLKQDGEVLPPSLVSAAR